MKERSNCVKSTHTEKGPTGPQDPGSNEEVRELVAHLFRHKAGEILSVLVKVFGLENLELAEDVVQETLVKALQQWPYSGVPVNPGGWILQVAKNHAYDILRRKTLFHQKEADIARDLEQHFAAASQTETEPFQDEQLTLMFTCCHPVIPREMQVALILKTLCGFSVGEIAKAFLAMESAIAQRIVRAKRKIREEKIRFELPESHELPSRLDSVLEAIYLLFNEGYVATSGSDLIRTDLCEEAIRLASLLAHHASGNVPKTHALLSLLYFQSSRLNARTDEAGNLFLLAEQDRSLWDKSKIMRGFFHLDQSATGKDLSRYHLEAGIASMHALAADFESTDWERIRNLYDMLYEMDPSPVILLNRAVTILMLYGPAEAIRALEEIQLEPALRDYYLLPATFGEMYARLGQMDLARMHYERTLQLVKTDPERRFVRRKLEALNTELEALNTETQGHRGK